MHLGPVLLSNSSVIETESLWRHVIELTTVIADLEERLRFQEQQGHRRAVLYLACHAQKGTSVVVSQNVLTQDCHAYRLQCRQLYLDRDVYQETERSVMSFLQRLKSQPLLFLAIYRFIYRLQSL